jgi:hypothetical protein
MRLAILIALLALAPSAQAQDRVERVRFQRGSTGATVTDAIVRGETVRYVLGARAGQRLTISIRSAESNAVFAVGMGNGSEPVGGWPASYTEFTGRLAESGDYVVEVGSTRGNATYTVTFGIR